MKPQTETAWAISHPHQGGVSIYTIRYTQEGAIVAAHELFGEEWAQLQDKGFYCVRVEIRELPEDKS